MTPVDALDIEHECDRAWRYRGSRSTWEGSDEVTERHFICDGCGLALNMEFRKPVGPPSGEVKR